MVRQKHVCVIGAGVSGLATARAFKVRGHLVTIVERSADLGGVWEPARSYPDVQTQSPKELYRFIDKPMPASYPEWQKGPQVHAYLLDYASQFDLQRLIRFRTTVVDMVRRPDGRPGWRLSLTGVAGSEQQDFDFVAICTGQFNEPQTLPLPGEDDFIAAGGRVLHSSRYADASLATNRRVVVLGGSKSATDIAVNAVRAGARSVTLVYRSPVWRIPYFIGGLINFKRILYVRAQEQMFPGWGLSSWSRLKHALARPFVWANWRALESLLKLQLKLKACNMVPDERIEDGINCSVPIATPDFYPMVADGRIRAVRGSLASYAPGAVIATDGTRIEADLAVLAIGFRLGVPFLPASLRERLIEPDGQYRLYRVIANPDLPDMGFVGFNSSFCTVLCADLAANWLVRYADGKLARQPSAAGMNENIAMMLRFKRDERPAAGVYGGLCVAPYHFRHFDELLDDMGASVRRRGALAERFTPPDADAYARFLASVPDYRVEAVAQAAE